MEQQSLTKREQEVLQLIAEGLTDKEIAARLGIARGTASNHVAVILLKLSAARRSQAVSIAFRRGLVGDAERDTHVEDYRVDEAKP
jgi:DNA-binding NarL/FixJ family response regulator